MKPLHPATAFLAWLAAMILLVLVASKAQADVVDYSRYIVWSKPVDNRPILIRLLTSISPVAEVASQNAAAKLDGRHLDLGGSDKSPGEIKWMPENWALTLTFKCDFHSFVEP